ncbi:MAG: two pore domain potassium channel family protein [Myxococcales bacterium]|nr:two pore domain potassium channel family protein [Myxococcales bacterium]
MKPSERSERGRLIQHREGRFVTLFFLSLVLHVAMPLAQAVPWLNLLVGLAFAAVLGYAGWITIEPGRRRKGYSLLMLISLISTATMVLSPRPEWRLGWLGFHAGLLGLSTVLVVRWAALRERITFDTVFAALSAYYLMGFTWALVHLGLDATLSGAFNRSLQTSQGFTDAFYFSFVTLTTLGYGDIVPTHPLTQALVTVEALVGQVYLVVLVARLVSLWGPRERVGSSE